jgi:hypothetical protein
VTDTQASQRHADGHDGALEGSGAAVECQTATECQRAAVEPVSALYRALSERELQADVVHGLRQRGFIVWTVPDMRMTTAGLPDVIAVHPDRAPLLMWELKTERGRVRPEQVKALRHLDKIPGIDARVVRPSDWAKLKESI